MNNIKVSTESLDRLKAIRSNKVKETHHEWLVANYGKQMASKIEDLEFISDDNENYYEEVDEDTGVIQRLEFKTGLWKIIN